MITIQTKEGNLMDVKRGHIVHGCNAQGVMGSGVALAVKQMYPEAFNSYRQQYLEHGLILGTAYPYVASNDLIIWNAITQEGFGLPYRNCSYDAIETCFAEIDSCLENESVSHIDKEVHIPAIGAGLGGGNWEIIREIIEQTMTHPVTLWIYKP